MVIAAFQRIRGLIGYRFGDVMRLIIEPAAGARQGRPTGWPVGGLASRTANALYTPRAPSFFFVTGGQRRSVTRSDHFQDGEARVTSTVVGRSPLQSSYVANERDFSFFFFSLTLSCPRFSRRRRRRRQSDSFLVRPSIFNFYSFYTLAIYYIILYFIVSPPFSAVYYCNINICRRHNAVIVIVIIIITIIVVGILLSYAAFGRDGFDFVSPTLMDTIPQTRCRDDGTERYRCPTVGISRETTTAKCTLSTTTPRRPLGSTLETGIAVQERY